MLLRFSRRTIAARAVAYARNRIPEFAKALAAKVPDLPTFDDEEQTKAFELLLQASLLAVGKVLAGQGLPIDVGVSKRLLVVASVSLAKENVQDLLGEGIDIPGVPESLEVWAGDLFAAGLTSALEWAETTPLLD